MSKEEPKRNTEKREGPKHHFILSYGWQSLGKNKEKLQPTFYKTRELTRLRNL